MCYTFVTFLYELYLQYVLVGLRLCVYTCKCTCSLFAAKLVVKGSDLIIMLCVFSLPSL